MCRTIFYIIGLLILSTASAYASDPVSWIGPIEVLSGTMTAKGGDFGFGYSLDIADCCCGGPATEDQYPDNILFDNDGHIIISDWLSSRIHIFDKNGNRSNTIESKHYNDNCVSDVYWPGTIYFLNKKMIIGREFCIEAYDYTGKLLWHLTPRENSWPEIVGIVGDKIVLQNFTERGHYSSGYKHNYNGWLIYDEYGNKITQLDDNHIADFIVKNEYEIKGRNVIFGDTTYNDVIKEDSLQLFEPNGVYRDVQKRLYVPRVNKKPENFERITEFAAGQLDIYSGDSKHIYSVILPINKYTKRNRSCSGTFAGKDVIEEYGKGIAVDSNGDVYSTLYLPNKYIIVKWLKLNLAGVLTTTDLKLLNKQQLRILRNEILARHGYIFNSPDLKSLFSKQPWYKPNKDYKDDMLTAIDKQNIDIIASTESKFKKTEQNKQ